VVIELDQRQVEVIGEPLPLDKAVPVSREEQEQNLTSFMGELVEYLRPSRR
jgi:hypothetical protein